MTASWIVLSLLLFSAPGQRQPDPIPARLPPVDDAALEPALRGVRDEILEAARAGDLAAIWRLTDPELRATYANHRGVARLKRDWEIDRSPKRFLDELVLVLSLGGRFETNARHSFVAPSMFVDFSDTESMGAYRVVIRDGAPVYARADDASGVIARCTNDVLRAATSVMGWMEVTLPAGRKGYMHDADVRGPADTRAYFTKQNGRWRLTGFYGGID